MLDPNQFNLDAIADPAINEIAAAAVMAANNIAGMETFNGWNYRATSIFGSSAALALELSKVDAMAPDPPFWLQLPESVEESFDVLATEAQSFLVGRNMADMDEVVATARAERVRDLTQTEVTHLIWAQTLEALVKTIQFGPEHRLGYKKEEEEKLRSLVLLSGQIFAEVYNELAKRGHPVVFDTQLQSEFMTQFNRAGEMIV